MKSTVPVSKSIRTGVCEVFETFDRIIVVEDDIVLRPGAYDFVSKALRRYKDLQHHAEQAEEKNLWYIGYALTPFLNRKVSYFPSESLVVNIGHDGFGENCGAREDTDQTLSDGCFCSLQGKTV